MTVITTLSVTARPACQTKMTLKLNRCRFSGARRTAHLLYGDGAGNATDIYNLMSLRSVLHTSVTNNVLLLSLFPTVLIVEASMMRKNRYCVLFTGVVFATFLFVQWNCDTRAKNMQQRQLMTTSAESSLHGAASNRSLSSPLSLSKEVNMYLAQDKQHSNKTVGFAVALSEPASASNSHIPVTSPSASADNEDRPTILYSHAKSDRTGAALQSMLAAHAFCYARNWTYGGACELSQDLPHDVVANQRAQQEMIQALGLDKVLPFACPARTVNGSYPSNSTHHILVARGGTYMSKGTKIFTSTWLKYIRSMLLQNGRLGEHRWLRTSERAGPLIAVHVRRGDINPCYPYFHARYLTNSYYLNVLDRYLPEIEKKRLRNDESQPSFQQVSIYSECENFEGWDRFSQRNYSMHLDTNLIDDVFYDMVSERSE
jgi:hypothetical protein